MSTAQLEVTRNETTRRRDNTKSKPDHKKTRRYSSEENTTVVTNIGMELYEWMKKIGDQHQANVALGWQKGIG